MATADRLKAEIVAWRRRTGHTWKEATAGEYADVPTARRAVRRALEAAEREHEARLAEVRDLRAAVFHEGGEAR